MIVLLGIAALTCVSCATFRSWVFPHEDQTLATLRPEMQWAGLAHVCVASNACRCCSCLAWQSRPSACYPAFSASSCSR